MKIEETPFHVTTVAGGFQKIQRVQGIGPIGTDADALELAFIDMLGALDNAAWSTQTSTATSTSTVKQQNDKTQAVNKKADHANSTETAKPAPESTTIAPAGADVREMVRKELLLRDADLTANDLAFLKQGLIPGLPILMGSVPIDQLFPKDESGEISYRGFEVSKSLSELIEKGIRTGRPIRVELDKQASIVLKFKNGQVSAEFLSNDQAAAMHIKQELDELRNRLLAKNLPVGSLEYRQQKRQQQQQDPDQPPE